MIVISDTSVFMNLAIIKQLDLLRLVFGEVTIPQAVYDELVIDGKGKPGSEAIKNAKWINVISCSNKILLNKVNQILDKGEAESIVLATEINADLLIIDEKKGRKIAKQYQLKITGLLGVLLIAKSKGLIQNVSDPISLLREKANFRISDNVLANVLKQAGE